MIELERSTAVLVLALAVTCLTAAPSRAADRASEGLDNDAKTRSLQHLARAALSGKAGEDVRVSRFGDGWTKVSVPLAPGVDFRNKAGLPLETMGITVDLFVPDLFADTVTYDVAPISGFGDYHWGWVTVNAGNQDIEARSTIQRKGPGPDFKATENVVYDANSMNLVFVERPVGDSGVQTVKVTVAGAKKLVGRVCPDCVPATDF